MTINPNDLVAYEFQSTTLCRDCLSDVLGIPPDAIEITLDRRANELGLNRYSDDTAFPSWFPTPIWRTQVMLGSPEEACTNCEQLLRLAPAIVYGPQVYSSIGSFTPEFDTEFPTQKGRSL